MARAYAFLLALTVCSGDYDSKEILYIMATTALERALESGKKLSAASVKAALGAANRKVDRYKAMSIRERADHAADIGRVTVMGSVISIGTGVATGLIAGVMGDETGKISIPMTEYKVPAAVVPILIGGAGVVLDVEGAQSMMAAGMGILTYEIAKDMAAQWAAPAPA